MTELTERKSFALLARVISSPIVALGATLVYDNVMLVDNRPRHGVRPQGGTVENLVELLHVRPRYERRSARVRKSAMIDGRHRIVRDRRAITSSSVIVAAQQAHNPNAYSPRLRGRKVVDSTHRAG